MPFLFYALCLYAIYLPISFFTLATHLRNKCTTFILYFVLLMVHCLPFANGYAALFSTCGVKWQHKPNIKKEKNEDTQYKTKYCLYIDSVKCIPLPFLFEFTFPLRSPHIPTSFRFFPNSTLFGIVSNIFLFFSISSLSECKWANKKKGSPIQIKWNNPDHISHYPIGFSFCARHANEPLQFLLLAFFFLLYRTLATV